MLKSSLLLAALLLPVFSAANADDYKAGDLLVSDPWSQEIRICEIFCSASKWTK